MRQRRTAPNLEARARWLPGASLIAGLACAGPPHPAPAPPRAPTIELAAAPRPPDPAPARGIEPNAANRTLDPDTAWDAAWAHFAAARAASEPSVVAAKLRRCATEFLAFERRFPDHPRADLAVANAVECAADAGDLDEAEAAWAVLQARATELDPYAYAALAIAELAQASGRYELALAIDLDFARRCPEHYEVDDALVSAYELTAALGRDTTEIVALLAPHRARIPTSDLSRIEWSTRPTEPEELLEFALAFERNHRDELGVALLEARQTIAELHWSLACPGRVVDGLCVADQGSTQSSGCTLGAAPLPGFVARRGKHARLARRWFEREARRMNAPREVFEVELEAVIRVWSAAVFNELELELERFLLAGPAAPDAREQATRLDARYRELADKVVARGLVEYAIRAHERRGLIWEVLATPSHREHAGECLATNAWAFGDRRRATSAYADCLELAVEQQWFDDVARRCEAWLAAADPGRTPALRELVGEPGFVPVRMLDSGVLSEP